MKQKLNITLVTLVVVGLLLGGCAPAATPTQEPASPTSASPSLGLPGKLEGKTWDEIVAAASGQKSLGGCSVDLNQLITG
jgi:hypothetical protein